MWFGTLVLKNIIRRPMRSFLTVVAIAIAIGSVVMLVGIARGFQDSFLTLYEGTNVDIIVVRAGGGQMIAGTIDEKLGEKMNELDGVKDVLPGLVDFMSLANPPAPGAVVQGFIPGTSVFDHLKFEAGRRLEPGDTKAVVLGTILAQNLNRKVGDTIEIIEDEKFTVVGICESLSTFENGAMIIPLHEMQRITDKKGKVTGFSLVLDAEGKRNVEGLKKQIEGLEKNLRARSTREHIDAIRELKLARAMAWLTSAIALIIGFFGMMNTMVMAVNERTKEIGILRAVGWRPRRVLRLVLFEAITLSQVGALVGVIGSFFLLRLLTRMPMVNGLIAGRLQPELVVYGFLIAAGVGVIGGILPARRAARMMPTEALRQE